MPVSMKKTVARFEGICTVEEAEPFLDWLLEGGRRKSVRFEDCTHLHAAILQVLMACRPQIKSWPAEDPLRRWLQIALEQPGGAASDEAAQPHDPAGAR